MTASLLHDESPPSLANSLCLLHGALRVVKKQGRAIAVQA